jgi:hypothetical protein
MVCAAACARRAGSRGLARHRSPCFVSWRLFRGSFLRDVEAQ